MRRSYDGASVERLLGRAAASHVPVISHVLANLPVFEYPWMSRDAFGALMRSQWREAVKVYWLELLYRAHFAALTSLLRTSRWIEAMIAHGVQPNYTAFTGAYRGYLEASADSFHSLNDVPRVLVALKDVIVEAVQGAAAQPSVCKDLEDRLIHFTHARYVQKGEIVDESHRARQTRQYLDALTVDGLLEVNECYRELCDVTHPGVGSVSCYVDPTVDPAKRTLRVAVDRDDELIADFCRRYENVSERSMFFGVVPPVLVLRALNDFPVPAVRTESVMSTGVDDHPAWIALRNAVFEPSEPPNAG